MYSKELKNCLHRSNKPTIDPSIQHCWLFNMDGHMLLNIYNPKTKRLCKTKNIKKQKHLTENENKNKIFSDYKLSKRPKLNSFACCFLAFFSLEGNNKEGCWKKTSSIKNVSKNYRKNYKTTEVEEV